MAQPVQKIEITPRSVAIIALILLGIYFVYLILDIIILLFVALILMTALNPIVNWMVKHEVPRGMSIATVYVALMLLLIAGFMAVIPELIDQLVSLFNQISLPPHIVRLFANQEYTLEDLQIITNQLTSIPKLIDSISSAFTIVIYAVTAGAMSFYMLLERDELHKHLVWLFGETQAEEKAEKFINKLELQIGHWVRGEFSLMFIVGFLTYIGLTILGIPYALPLAILAGLLEILPNIGPTLSAVPALIVAYLAFGSWWMVLAVLALYIAVQQLENNFIVPAVMKRSVGLNPLVTILLILIGLKLGGIVGAILVIPIFLVIKVTIVEFWKIRLPGHTIRL